MGQSLVKNYIHIIFGTRFRQPWITESIESELHAYLGGICKKLDCTPIKVGGYSDHVHVLCMLSKKFALMKLVEELKAHSSKWIKTKDDSFKNFYWQGGYGAFSVKPSEVDSLIRYIDQQKLHHTGITFQDEYLEIFKFYKVDFDDRYLWG
jgi:putative transposase